MYVYMRQVAQCDPRRNLAELKDKKSLRAINDIRITRQTKRKHYYASMKGKVPQE